MEPITITFLGTGNAVPTEKRNHTAMLLTYKNENILIDCGEGTQRQFRIAQLSPNKITKLLITHWHGDHVLGIPGLFQTLALQEYQNNLQIFGPPKTKMHLESLNNVFGFKINCSINESSGIIFQNDEFQLVASKMSHGIQTHAYSFTIKDKFRLDKDKLKKLKLPNSPLLKKLAEGKDITVQGKKIKAKNVAYQEKGRKVAFILDTKMNSEAVELAKDADILICEATFSEKEKEIAEEYKHLTATDAATIAKKAKVKKLILTHISQRYENFPEIILKEAKKIFKNTELVKDFDVVEI